MLVLDSGGVTRLSRQNQDTTALIAVFKRDGISPWDLASIGSVARRAGTTSFPVKQLARAKTPGTAEMPVINDPRHDEEAAFLGSDLTALKGSSVDGASVRSDFFGQRYLNGRERESGDVIEISIRGCAAQVHGSGRL